MALRLYLLRHAHAEPGHSRMEDAARELDMQGRREAAAICAYLMDHEHINPEYILCSSATRTRSTLDGVKSAFSTQVSIQFMDKLYHASASQMRSILAEWPALAQSVMIIGHNPGMHELSDWLAGEGAHPRKRAELAMSFPTASLVALSFPGIMQWSDLQRGSGVLDVFVTPAELMLAA